MGAAINVGNTLTYAVSGKSVGVSYQYRVKTCNTDQACSEYTAPFTVTIPEPDWALTGGGDLIADAALQPPLVPAHQNVGAVRGQGDVAGGEANYSIPIQIPAGRNGVEPRLTVGYSNRAGNGALGMGWSLQAGSTITRCPQTVAQDGRNLKVQYSSTEDRLCLDGQRLIAVAGTYGASGSEYRTETESFTKVVQNGALNSGSTWFKVELKNGRIRFYGHDSNSRHVADGVAAIKAWAITKETDRSLSKNSIIYNYAAFGKGEHLLTDI